MRVAIGIKPHSGWAALVTIAREAGELQILDRRRIELVEPAEAGWAKQPYHAAQKLPALEAKQLIERGIRAARAAADRQMTAMLKWVQQGGHQLAGCAVLVGAALPDWTPEEILSVHMRMHQAEGWLFPMMLAQAAAALQIKMLTVREKELLARVAGSTRFASLADSIASRSKAIGPPWGKDQKSAALAAALVLEG